MEILAQAAAADVLSWTRLLDYGLAVAFAVVLLWQMIARSQRVDRTHAGVVVTLVGFEQLLVQNQQAVRLLKLAETGEQICDECKSYHEQAIAALERQRTELEKVYAAK